MILNALNNIKRAAIYVFFDKDGTVDEYVCKLLDSLHEVCHHIVVVVNGKISKCGKFKLEKYADNLIFRENKGYDITAYICGLNYLQKNFFNEYDEVVLLNSTLYGPFFPINKMFNEMALKDLDFWGLLKHYAAYDTSIASSKYNYIPEYIQSYFMVLRRSLLYSKDLEEYISKLPEIKNYNDARGKFEIEFTKDISEKGYQYDAYLDMNKYKEYSSNFIMWLPYELILKGCPFLKQKSFNFGPELMLSTTQTQKAYDFIEKNTDYDTELIINNILRTQNIADIKTMLQINYSIPSKGVLTNTASKELRVASLIDTRLDLPKLDALASTDIFLIVGRNTILSDLKSKAKMIIQSDDPIEKIICENLKAFTRDYDVLCILPNIREENFTPYYDGLFYKKNVLENIADSADYVKNIVAKFSQVPKLGLLVSPPYYCGQHETIYPNGWDGCFEEVKKAANVCGIAVNLDLQKQPIVAYGSALWARPKALASLEGKEIYNQISKEAFERLYAFSAQNEGYLSGYVMTDRNAAQILTSLEYMAKRYGALQNYFLRCKRKLKKILPSKLIGKILNIVGK